jgi:hypothetical protein
MDMAARREVWLEISDISEAEFEAHMAEEKAREAIVPRPGDMAPDCSGPTAGAPARR